MVTNSNTELYSIFGRPVRHSMSPAMHNAAFRELGINAVYLAFEPPSIGPAIEAMKALGIRGASVTIPYKMDALDYCEDIEPLAADIGSVNTLLNLDGRIIGHNTDGYGAVRALEKGGISLEGTTCLVIGNGGSARAIAFTLLTRGSSVVIAGRNRSRAESLVSDLRRISPDTRAVHLPDLDAAAMKNIDIVINTTPIGMAPEDNTIPLDPALITSCHTVFDIVYTPRITRLLRESADRGAVIVHGIDMLFYQGALQFEIWTGKPAPLETMFLAVGDIQRKP
ncbi:MAG: shikimate dehydrogenase [Chrysiogenales bacterium]|nr:MAG: shikimate dehydrogenase [Chrysiogenales bacterium]